MTDKKTEPGTVLRTQHLKPFFLGADANKTIVALDNRPHQSTKYNDNTFVASIKGSFMHEVTTF